MAEKEQNVNQLEAGETTTEQRAVVEEDGHVTVKVWLVVLILSWGYVDFLE